MPALLNAIQWLNANQGVVSVIIFVLTLLIAWMSGLFKSIRQKPSFLISVIEGPSLCCTIETGNESNGYKHTRTGISVYIHIANVGFAPSGVEGVALGFKWVAPPFSYPWFKYVLGWFWIEHAVIIIEDFKRTFNGNIRLYPFLFQKSHLTGHSGDTYLEIGKSVSGMVYFETPECWGACKPGILNSKTRIKLAVRDVFGRRHYHTCHVPVVDIDTARLWNPSFLLTHDTLDVSKCEASAT